MHIRITWAQLALIAGLGYMAYKNKVRINISGV